MIIFFVVISINVIILYSSNKSLEYVSFDTGLISSIGIIFGPWSALITTMINSLISSPFMTPTELILDTLINLLIGLLPYKLWYCFSNDKKVSTPKLYNVYNLTKFIGIITANSLLYSILTTAVYNQNIVIEYTLMSLITYFLNSFISTFIIGIIILTIFSKVITIPNNKFTIKTKYSNIALIIGIITLIPVIITTFLKIEFINKTVGMILLYITIFSFLTFSLREIKYEPQINESFYSKIIEKIILIFLAINIMFLIIISVATYNNILRSILSNEPSISFLLNLFLGILTTFIPGIIILKYVEDKFTTPITLFAKTTQDYIKTGNHNDINYISNYSHLIENNTEIKEIANSFTLLIDKLEEHVSNLQRITAEKERIDAELTIATEIQKSNLPKNFLTSDKFEINASMNPAREVGGDFYDFYLVDENKLAIIIGDASGKGVPAAMFAVITQSLIKNQLLLGINLKDIFESINNLLCENNETSMFITVWAGTINLNTGDVTFVNAGHNAPIISRNNKFEYLKTKHNLVLGAMENIKYKENSFKLTHEDIIYLYTDGITEAHNPDDELFGETHLLEILNKYDFNVKTIIPNINDEVEEFVKGRKQYDDMTMLVLKYK